MTHKTNLLYVLLFMIIGFNVSAQDWQTEKRVNILFGLSQPLVAHGFNIEFNYIFNRLIFDFSTGVGLTFIGDAIPASLQQQVVEVYMPWATGFGIAKVSSECILT